MKTFFFVLATLSLAAADPTVVRVSGQPAPRVVEPKPPVMLVRKARTVTPRWQPVSIPKPQPVTLRQ